MPTKVPARSWASPCTRFGHARVSTAQLGPNQNYWLGYCPYLSLRYTAHINVKVCYSVQSVKYLIRYIYKGKDRQMVRADDLIGGDEIETYQDLRSIGASEACWRLFDVPMSQRQPNVVALQVHMQDQQLVYFQPGEERQAAQAVRRTHLTASPTGSNRILFASTTDAVINLIWRWIKHSKLRSLRRGEPFRRPRIKARRSRHRGVSCNTMSRHDYAPLDSGRLLRSRASTLPCKNELSIQRGAVYT